MALDLLAAMSLALTAVFVVALIHGTQQLLLALHVSLGAGVPGPDDQALLGAAWILIGSVGVLVMLAAGGITPHT